MTNRTIPEHAGALAGRVAGFRHTVSVAEKRPCLCLQRRFTRLGDDRSTQIPLHDSPWLGEAFEHAAPRRVRGSLPTAGASLDPPSRNPMLGIQDGRRRSVVKYSVKYGGFCASDAARR
jgi:hypothetical protein